jgi:hypothetical protein
MENQRLLLLYLTYQYMQVTSRCHAQALYNKHLYLWYQIALVYRQTNGHVNNNFGLDLINRAFVPFVIVRIICFSLKFIPTRIFVILEMKLDWLHITICYRYKKINFYSWNEHNTGMQQNCYKITRLWTSLNCRGGIPVKPNQTIQIVIEDKAALFVDQNFLWFLL